ncbi:MAG TPA: MAPEG family protein [Steroidobacteraceae bacterium]|nr:MAPEG family protein [Steroidobacteraceae bacterium]
MTAELKWLVYTALLAGSLWIPYIIGVNITDFAGKRQQFVRPPDPSQMKPWVHRSLRAHQNLLEQLLPFSIVVLAGAVSRVSTSITIACSITFFWLRVAHAVGMISGLARLPLRPLIYFVGWIVMLIFAWQVLRNAA